MSTLEKNLYKLVQVEPVSPINKPIANRSYRGLSTVDENKEFKKFDVAIIKQDILNHLYIRIGEKLENPEFGNIIWDVLYEPFTDTLKQSIIQNLTEIVGSDPRVTVDAINVDSYESGIQVEFEVTYLEYNISEFLQLEFDRNNGLI